MQQQLEKEILALTVELGNSHREYDELRKRYATDWTMRDPSRTDDLLKDLQDLANELNHYNTTFNKLARDYASIVLDGVSDY